jgi:uncharacterized membrane protein
MLLGACRVLFDFCVIALAIMFRRGAMGLCGIFVVFGSLIMFVFSHWIPPDNIAVTA